MGGPPGAVDVTLTINAAVLVKSSGSGPAITTQGMHPDSTLTLINNGEVHGGGGDAGAGGNIEIASFFEPEPPGICYYDGTQIGAGGTGGVGSDAIEIVIASVDIDNTNGEIFGGGGGGGGGKAARTSATANAGGGGGGGLGESTSNGGAGGVATEGDTDPLCSVFLNQGSAGTGGTDSANGTGGSGPGAAGDGGDGGSDWAVTGDAGGNGGGGGGVGGYAVRLNGASIAWQGGNNAAQVKGTVG